MLRYAVLLTAIASVSVSLADDGTISLADAVQAINKQATKFPETRDQSPLTEEEIIKSLENFSNPKPGPDEQYRELRRLSDEDFQKLKGIVKTHRLPKDVVLRQFVRYKVDTCVEHGWWVRLILMRQDVCPFSLTIRQESVFRRPFTQKERQFEDDMQRTGSIPTMGRVVVYFDENPKFGTVQEFVPQDAERLADAVKKAINDKNVDDLLNYYHWEKVDDRTRSWVREEAEQVIKRQLSKVYINPRRFSGSLKIREGFKIWDSNLPVLGYVVLEFADTDGQKSVWLEFGKTPDGARLVNYIVSQDDGPRMIGKPLPGGGFRVHSFQTLPPENGWSDLYDEINAPDELPALQNANFEIWRMPLNWPKHGG
jgi:hypothetical protein